LQQTFKDGKFLVVDIGSQHTTVDILEDGKITRQKSVSFGADSTTDLFFQLIEEQNPEATKVL
jgi:hypothetical protein